MKTPKDPWYRCSKCGKDYQLIEGKIKMCCWADKYLIKEEDTVVTNEDS